MLRVDSVRLSGFEFEHYRSFLTRSRVRLGAKLTLLFGYNNAGKSALLRGLVLLAASCHPDLAKTRQPLALDHPVARGASFEGLVTRGHAARLTVGLSWDDGTRLAMKLLEPFKFGEGRQTPLVETLNAQGVDGTDLSAVWQPNEGLEPIYEMRDGTTENIRFDGLLLAKRFSSLRSRLEAFGKSVHWLPPTRRPPADRYPAAGDVYDSADPIPFLARIGQDHIVHRDVQSGLGRLAGVEMSIGRDARGAYADIAPQGLPGNGVPLGSVGEGINQVLPVLTLAAMARRGQLGATPLVAIEQPELHLHPAAELSLVDVLLEACSGDARFVLETHSETLLLGLQLAVVEGRLSPEDVSIAWVERGGAGLSTVREVPLRSDGAREGWPPGVFSEHLVQARKILEAREAKQT